MPDKNGKPLMTNLLRVMSLLPIAKSTANAAWRNCVAQGLSEVFGYPNTLSPSFLDSRFRRILQPPPSLILTQPAAEAGIHPCAVTRKHRLPVSRERPFARKHTGCQNCCGAAARQLDSNAGLAKEKSITPTCSGQSRRNGRRLPANAMISQTCALSKLRKAQISVGTVGPRLVPLSATARLRHTP